MSTGPKFETAVLIDGENIPADSYEQFQKALKPYEPIAVIRVYGDFSNSAHADWIGVCRKCAIAAELHLPVSAKKNGTDMVMTIAAMDLMASGKFGTIVLVSDDSDFLPVARRLRASGLTVVSAGRKPHLAQHSAYSARIQFAAPLAREAPMINAVAPDKIPQSPKLDFSEAKFRKALMAILTDQSMTLSSIGKKLREAYPEVAAAIGKNKLQIRIRNDNAFVIASGLVHRKLS